MFREMRRKRQLMGEAETIAVLENGKTGILAVSGDDGYPYAVPLNYVYADGKIFFHCAKKGHKIDAIRGCEKVSFCVIDKDDIVSEELTTYFRSVICFGKARILQDDAEIDRAATLLGLKYNPDAARVAQEIRREWAALCVVEITVEHMTGKEAVELLPEGK